MIRYFTQPVNTRKRLTFEANGINKSTKVKGENDYESYYESVEVRRAKHELTFWRDYELYASLDIDHLLPKKTLGQKAADLGVSIIRTGAKIIIKEAPTAILGIPTIAFTPISLGVFLGSAEWLNEGEDTNLMVDHNHNGIPDILEPDSAKDSYYTKVREASLYIYPQNQQLSTNSSNNGPYSDDFGWNNENGDYVGPF